jgi:4-aminobutyrate aminotransferase-like enzyme
VRNAGEVGHYFFDRLYGLQDKYPMIGDVRGKGLMIGIEMVKEDRVPNPEAVLRISELCKQKRLLVGKGGLYGNVLRIAPPLNIERGDVEDALRVLDEVLARI